MNRKFLTKKTEKGVITMKYYYCCGKQLINLASEENQRKGYGEFICNKCGEIYRTEIEEIYENVSEEEIKKFWK